MLKRFPVQRDLCSIHPDGKEFMSVTRTSSVSDLMVKATMLVTMLMSGGTKMLSPYTLASVNAILLLALYAKDRTCIHKSMHRASALLLFLFLYMAILSSTVEDVTYLLSRASQFGLAFLLVNYIIVHRLDFVRILQSVLLLFLIHGILNFIAINVFESAFAQTRTNLGSPINSFLIFFFGSRTIDLPFLGVVLHRNIGAFGEGGIFQIHMNLLFFTAVFVRRNYLIALLAMFMVASTFSTVGLIILLIQALVFLVYDYRSSSFREELLLIAILPLLVGGSFLCYLNFQEKFFGERSGSFDIRTHDTRIAADLVWENPLGVGFSTQKHIRMTSDDSYFIRPRDSEKEAIGTNSIMTVFYSTGVLWGLIIMYSMYRQCLLGSKRPLVFALLVLSLSSQPLFYSPFFLLFPISGMASKSFVSNGGGAV